MTTNTLLLAIAAGIVSAVVFASATTGAVPLRVVLFFLTPLSLYLAGLGLGPAAAAIAVIVATLAILAMTNPIAAFVFIVSTGMPAALTTRYALLGREREVGPKGGMAKEIANEMEWYPIGRVIAAATLFGGLFAALALMLMGGDADAMTKAIRSAVEQFAKMQTAQIPGAPAVTDAQIDEITKQSVTMLPYSLAALSLMTTFLNLWLAGRITLASGRLVRPWPDISAFTLPVSASLILAAALALSFMDGLPGMVSQGFAGAYLIAFALMGIAVVHAMTRGSPWRNFLLAGLYAMLVIANKHAVLVLAIAGLAETFFHYRAASNSGAPKDSN
jgi:Predicted membrane protein (DUF2232)